MANALGNNGGRLYSFGAQPVLIDCNFIVDPTNANGLGVRSLKGQGVEAVYMHTSQTPDAHNPNPASGYALIKLASNYNRYLGGFAGSVAPVTGNNIQIDSGTAGLTPGLPYVITGVGAGPSGAATIQPVADVAKSLAGKYFQLQDSYGNTFIIWFVVDGVGSRPNLGVEAPAGARGLRYVQQTIATGATAGTIGTALAVTINQLDSGIQGLKSFTASGTTTVTVTSTAAQPLAGPPRDGTTTIPEQGPAVPLVFTVTSANATAGAVYTDGSGHLYTVTTTLVAGTTLLTSGVGAPEGATLTKVSGTGDATIAFSACVTGYATGFTFALTVSDTNLQDWEAVGLPKGLTPAVGQAFIATASGAGGSTGTVKAVSTAGITRVEVIGDSNLTLAPQPQGGSAYVGGYIIVQFMAATSASVTTQIPTAPAAGSVIGMSFYVDARQSPSNTSSH